MRFPEWGVAPSDPAEGVDCYWIMNGAMVVGAVHGPQSDHRQFQRAQLIAAAPDLFEALDQLLDDMGDDGLCVCGDAKDQAKAALAKARGEVNI